MLHGNPSYTDYSPGLGKFESENQKSFFIPPSEGPDTFCTIMSPSGF